MCYQPPPPPPKQPAAILARRKHSMQKPPQGVSFLDGSAFCVTEILAQYRGHFCFVPRHSRVLFAQGASAVLQGAIYTSQTSRPERSFLIGRIFASRTQFGVFGEPEKKFGELSSFLIGRNFTSRTQVGVFGEPEKKFGELSSFLIGRTFTS